MNRLKTIALNAPCLVEMLRAYARLCFRLWRGDNWLRFEASLFLHTLLAHVMGHEVVYEMNFKGPGPDRSSLGPERWKPSTRNHPAFESSHIYEFTYTVIRPGEDFECPPASRIDAPGS
jgi:hypothetical protein